MRFLSKLFKRRVEATPEMVGTMLLALALRMSATFVEEFAESSEDGVDEGLLVRFSREQLVLRSFAVDYALFQLVGEPLRERVTAVFMAGYWRLPEDTSQIVMDLDEVNERLKAYGNALRQELNPAIALGSTFASFCGSRDARVLAYGGICFGSTRNAVYEALKDVCVVQSAA